MAAVRERDARERAAKINERVIVRLGQAVNDLRNPISAQAVALKTESAERSDVLVTKQLENIAVNGRSYLALAALTPGVVSTGNFQQAGTAGLGAISANGARLPANGGAAYCFERRSTARRTRTMVRSRPIANRGRHSSRSSMPLPSTRA